MVLVLMPARVCSVQCLCAARKAAAAGVGGKETSCRAPWVSWCTGPSLLDHRKRMGMSHLVCAALIVSLVSSPAAHVSIPLVSQLDCQCSGGDI